MLYTACHRPPLQFSAVLFSRPLRCALLATALACAAGASHATEIVDAAGRRVSVPERIERVFAAGPPAAILLYTLAPERLVGWNRRPPPSARAFLAAPYAQLPEVGRLTGRGGSTNLEVLLQARPDLVLDYGTTSPTFVSLAERVQAQTGLPYVLLDGSFDRIPETYRRLGRILGVEARAERLAQYAENVLARAAALRAAAGKPPRVYYARGREGLETGAAGSINVELLERVGAVNVAAAAAGKRNLVRVSPEQVLAWDPDTIITLEPDFYRDVFSDPLWRQLRAVRNGRVYLAPHDPFGWFDRPPSVNRLIGVPWLAEVLDGQGSKAALAVQAREFYRLFYHLDLDDDALERLLTGAAAGRV